MKESVFCKEIVDSLRAQNCWAYKIPDLPFKNQTAKPCDILFFKNRTGGMSASGGLIECKQIKRLGVFGVKDMRPSQIEALDDALTRGIPAFIFLNIRMPGSQVIEAIRNRLLIFNWKSFKLNERYSITQLKGRGGVDGYKGQFDLRYFIQNFDV